MIITRTPFRMSFFGGGTDYEPFFREYGGSVISTTFDKYCYVTVRHQPRFFDYANQVTYNVIERTKSVDEIEHPVVRNAMKRLDMQELRVTYDADLPARSGLGSSSAFTVGLLNGFYALKGKSTSKKHLAEEAIYIERELCGESGGWQDQIAVAYGGLNRIDFSSEGFSVHPLIVSRARKQLLNDHLMLYFTGFSRLSSDIAAAQMSAIKHKRRDLLEMLTLVDDCQRILTEEYDINEFGRLLAYAWNLKRSLTDKVTNDTIDALYTHALNAGAIGGKLLGAGGGGFLLLFVEPDKQHAVKEAMSSMLRVPFTFENEGTNIMYYAPEEWSRTDEIEGLHNLVKEKVVS